LFGQIGALSAISCQTPRFNLELRPVAGLFGPVTVCFWEGFYETVDLKLVA